jgi:poly-gamma-glutamate synthesis protein (capsule biosynthesis protein)
MARILLSFMITVSPLFSLAQDTTRLSMLFLGDIMQHDSQIADAYDPITKSYDYRPCFQYVKPYTQAVDLAIGNLELTLAGPPYKGYPQFGAPDELLVALKDMGMDVLVTANNHCVDRGKKGLERTIQMLDSFNILHTGTFVDEVERLNLHPLLIEKNGFKLTLLNYTYGTNGLPVHKPNIVSMIQKDQIKKDLDRAKDMQPDAIIVFIHWGAEYQSMPSDWQKDIAAFCFNNGAHMVIGAHPHVLQPMEWNRKENKLIAWSLGNFVSGQRKRYTDGGSMIRIELEKIRFNDTLAYTGIDTAGYILEWVYRTADQEKNYYILPVPTVEPVLNNFVKDETSREAFKTFVDDSRALFRKNNIQINEVNSAPEYLIELSGNYSDTLKLRQVIEDPLKIKIIRDAVLPRIQLGPYTEPDAVHILHKLKLDAATIRRKSH